jgi:hypothetical protein
MASVGLGVLFPAAPARAHLESLRQAASGSTTSPLQAPTGPATRALSRPALAPTCMRTWGECLSLLRLAKRTACR